jgi:hypothetical protein
MSTVDRKKGDGMRTRLMKFAAAIAALAALAVGASTLASASSRTAPHPLANNVQQGNQSGKDDATEVSQPEQADGTDAAEASKPESEGAADAAAQAAACKAAGIDANAPNIQYDDQSGVCSLDAGGGDGGN